MKQSKSGKKLLASLLSFGIAASLLGGCSSGSSGSKEDSSKSEAESSSEAQGESLTVKGGEGATDLSMWVFVEIHGQFYAEMVKEWNAKNPDKQINLTVTTYPYDDMHNKLTLALQSGEGAPDLCDIEVGKFPNFLKGTPQLADLTEYIKPYKDSIVPSRLALYSKDGKNYGVPTHVGATVMFYNTEILDKAGVDYTKIKTWDDYLEAGKKVVDKTDAYMGTIDTGGLNNYLAVLAELGSDYTTEDGKPNVDTPEMAKAISLFKSFKDAGISGIIAGGHSDTEEGFGEIVAGKFASVIEPLWYMSRFTNYMPELSGKIAIAPIPVFEEGQKRSVGLGGTGTVVTKTSKNLELAAEWLTWAKLSEDGNIQIWKILGFDPVNTAMWTNKEVTHDPENQYVKYFKNNPFDVLNEIRDEISLIKSNEAVPSLANYLCTTTFNSIFEDGADIEEALKEAQEQVELELG